MRYLTATTSLPAAQGTPEVSAFDGVSAASLAQLRVTHRSGELATQWIRLSVQLEF